MKFLSNTSFKSLAAVAAALLFVSSAVYAACPTDCSSYAATGATIVKNSVYSQVYYSCLYGGGSSWTCREAAESNSQSAYTWAYNNYYGQCRSGNCP